MSRAWMPLYVGDYLKDTSNLSVAEHGAYLLLILFYWQHGGLPDDEDELSTIARMSEPEWAKARKRLSRFFYDGWKHKRVEKELAKADEKYEKRAAAGKRGGIAKAAGKQTASKPPSNATSKPPSNVVAKTYQPHLRDSYSSSTSEALAPSANSKSEEGRKVGVSPSDPLLNGTLDEWREHYPAPTIAELQFKFESQAVEALLPELWEWSGTKTTKANERMKMIYKTLENKHKAATEGPALMAEEPASAVVSSQLANSRMVKSAAVPHSAFGYVGLAKPQQPNPEGE